MPDSSATLAGAVPVDQTVSFHVNGFDIDNALTALQPVWHKRNTVPILSMVRITGTREALVFEVTDLDATFTYALPGGYPEFDVCVDYESLRAFARTLHSSLFRVEAGRHTFRVLDFLFATPEGIDFYCLPAGDFPTMKAPTFAHEVEIDPSLVARVRASMSTEETRYYLHGAYFHAVDGKLHLVSTDGHRLNLLKTAIDYAGPGVIVPRGIAAWIARQKKPGRLALDPTAARWTSGNLTVVTKCMDGKFPDYERVIPKETRLTARVRRRPLLNVIAALRAFNTTKSFAVKFSFLGDVLTLHHSDSEKGRVAMKLDDVDFSGRLSAEAFELGFNGGYVVDALNNIISDEAEFHFVDCASPAVIIDGDLTSLLMPLRV